MTQAEKEAERFNRYTQKTSHCWLWIASVTDRGYGQFHYSGRRGYAHRYAFEAFNGSIPNGLFVCHTCDNRQCVNPAHLFIGTPRENMHDMIRKGRSRDEAKSNPGSRNGRAKLSETDVRLIRSIGPAEGLTVLARRFGVTPTTIKAIQQGRLWRSLR